MSQPATAPARGFTLIEVLAVLAILGLAMGLIIGRGPARPARLTARAGAAQFADALHRAANLAMVSGVPVRVVVDIDRHLYAQDGAAPRGFAPDLAVSLLPGMARLGPTRGVISFSPDGSASGGGLRLVRGRYAQVVAVEWLTGRIVLRDE